MRVLPEKTARRPGDYVPDRREGDHLQVIGVMNFKGGFGKTTTAAHLAQRLALRGYRVLGIDLDPQTSFTALHGVQPEFDLVEGGTLYDAIRQKDPRTIRDVIRPTYIPNLDLLPGNLELMEVEHETPRALSSGNAGLFFFRVREALSQVDADYDVVVIDCPPQLGFLTMSALSAATGVLVTIHPEMLDVMSMSQFLRMTADLKDVIAESGADMSLDWMRHRLTRYDLGVLWVRHEPVRRRGSSGRLWRAVDASGDVPDILGQSRRNTAAASSCVSSSSDGVCRG